MNRIYLLTQWAAHQNDIGLWFMGSKDHPKSKFPTWFSGRKDDYVIETVEQTKNWIDINKESVTNFRLELIYD